MITAIKRVSIGFLMLTSFGCVYRFSNLHLSAPAGARSIAIEGIYDTSKTVIPHEYLWQSIQKQFAISGLLQLASQEQADLYLRVQVEDVDVSSGTSVRQTIKDPIGFTDQSLRPSPPRSLGDYPSYRKASSYAKEDKLNVVTKVELWDLRGNKKLFQQVFSAQEIYPILHSGAAVEYGFLMADEKFEQAFARLSETIAKAIVVRTLSL